MCQETKARGEKTKAKKIPNPNDKGELKGEDILREKMFNAAL